MVHPEKQFRTFAGFPYQTDFFGLVGKIAIIGIPFGTPYPEVSQNPSAGAPGTIREESNRYPDDSVAWDFDLEGTLDKLAGGKIVDCGDLTGKQGDAAFNRETARKTIKKLLEAGSTPVVLGGDDSIPIPVLAAYHDQEPFLVVQMDAHIDWRYEVNGIREGYSSTMRRASEMPWVKGIIQVGMRGVGSARKEEYTAAMEYGARIVTARQFHQEGIKSVLKYLPDTERCFLNIDFDVLDPSIMPAVGAPTPGGLFYQETIDLVFEISRRMNIIGTCLVELIPEADVNHLGSITAMRIAWNAIAAIARQRYID